MTVVIMVGSLIASSLVFALIMFAPKNELDKAIEDALAFKANQDKITSAIRGYKGGK